MTDFELLKAFLDGKQDFNYSIVESIGFKKIVVDERTMMFTADGRYLESIKHKVRG